MRRISETYKKIDWRKELAKQFGSNSIEELEINGRFPIDHACAEKSIILNHKQCQL